MMTNPAGYVWLAGAVAMAAWVLVHAVMRSRLRRALGSWQAATAEAKVQRRAATSRLASTFAAMDTAPEP